MLKPQLWPLKLKLQLKRNDRGNILIFSICCTAFLAAAVCYFALSYVRTIGQYNQQVSAIDAAALAAATDVGKVVISDSNWGLVSLSLIHI